MATIMEDCQVVHEPGARLRDLVPVLGRRLEYAMPWLIGLAACVLAVVLWAEFWQESRSLWHSIDHDRNAHYEFGVNLAMDVRHGNIVGLLHHLDGARVWGPLHGILLGLVQTVVGPDYRFGILPSLLGWIATAVLGFLLAKRLLPDGGLVAGVLAAIFILLSPAHRAFATDVMLESMGAALTLLCLLRYLIAVQDTGSNRGRWLGLSLTLLFLTKANYWLLIVMGMTAAEVLRRPQAAWAVAESFRQKLSNSASLRKQARSPWNYLLAGLIGLIMIVVLTGGTVLQVGPIHISLTRAHNLVHIAYIVAFIRVVLWWRREKVAERVANSGPVARGLVYWHAWPAAVYFLLPKRLGYFLWYISPANADREAGGLARGMSYYMGALGDDYHVFGWLLPVVLLFVGIAALTFWRWRSGAMGVFVFLGLACLATCQHPMLKSRHAHTWVAILWILGSAGLVHIVYCSMASLPRARFGIVAALYAALLGVHSHSLVKPGRAPEGGVRPGAPSILAITDAYLPALNDARRSTLVLNVYSPFFLAWTFQESLRHQRMETDIKGYTSDQPDLRALEAWARTTHCDALVLIGVAKDSPFYTHLPTNLDTAAAWRFFEQTATGFHLTQEWSLPERVRIGLWRKSAPVAQVMR